jgi:hypothetical protein
VRTYSVWTDADIARLRHMRALGWTYPSIVREFNGRFSRSACQQKGLALGMTADILGIDRNWKAVVRAPLHSHSSAAITVDLIPTVEPAPLAIGPDGIMAASFRYVLAWCLWAGFTTNGTDIDTRVNKMRLAHNRAPFVVVA